MDDLFSSYKGPGLIGMLLGILVLASFAGLGLAVFDGRLNGDFANSLNKKVVAQSDEIKRLESRAANLEQTIEDDRQKQEVRGELKVLTKKAELLSETQTGVAEELEGSKAAVEQVAAAQREYRQLYRDSVRARAEGKQLEQLETISGKTYKSVKIKSVSPVGISIVHESGIKRIPYRELPSDMQDYYQFGEDEAAEHFAREAEIAGEVAARIKSEGAKNKVQRERAAEQRKVEDRDKMERKIADLQRGIQSAKGRVTAEEQKAADYRRLHSEALARGNVSSHLSSARKAEQAANRLRNQISQAQNQIAELQRRLAEND